MTRKFAITGALFFGLVIAGTASTDTAKNLVGVWQVKKEDGKPREGMSLEFTADRKVIRTFSAEKGEKEAITKGTYTVKDGVITLSFEKVDVEAKLTAKIKKLTDTDLHFEIGDFGGKETSLVELKRVKK